MHPDQKLFMNIPTRLSLLSWGCALLSAVLSFWLFWQAASLQISQLQQTHQAAIQQLLANHLTGDTKILTRQLSSSFQLPYLKLSQLDGAVLHEHDNAESGIELARYALALFAVSLDPMEIRDELHGLTVSFSPALQQLLRQLQWQSLLLSFASALLVLLPFYRLKNQPARKPSHALHPLEKVAQQATGQAVSQTQTSTSGTTAADYLLELALVDQLTGLPNRQQFVRSYETLLKNANAVHHSLFVVIRCENLNDINQQQGYLAGDLYIKEMADQLRQLALTPQPSLFRLNHTDFCLLQADASPEQAQQLADLVLQQCQLYLQQKNLSHPVLLGLVLTHQGKALGELLALADTAIGLARQQHGKGSVRLYLYNDQEHSAHQTSFSPQNWRQLLDDIIEQQLLTLLGQMVQPLNKGSRSYTELLVRFRSKDEQLLPTALVLEMAGKLDRLLELEKLIVEQAMALASRLPTQTLGINLSAGAVQDEQFVAWLDRRLSREPELCSRLVFEISEQGLQHNLRLSKRLLDLLHQQGARVTVERFGMGITSFKFFRELKPDFVKLDGSYTRQIEDDKNNQYFIRLMVDLAHRIGIAVLAENVETAAEKQMLESLLVDGLQGYYLNKPAALE